LAAGDEDFIVSQHCQVPTKLVIFTTLANVTVVWDLIFGEFTQWKLTVQVIHINILMKTTYIQK